MINLFKAYTHWLHSRWPAGTLEKLPEVGEEGKTNVPGVRVVGDLSGIPLLKFSSETGTKAIHAFLEEPDFTAARGKEDEVYDVAIVGSGVSGVSAAIEAKKAGLRYVLFEASQVFSTVANFPKAKPIYTYPTEMTPSGGIQFSEEANVKEKLLEEMEKQREEAGIDITSARIERVERKGGHFLLHHGDEEKTQTKALRVVVAIGRSGNFRKLGVPGEDLDKVSNRLHDPKEFIDKDVLVVGGGDSAMEAAIALASSGARVVLSYRKPEFSRPKPENIKKIHALAKNPCALVAVENPSSERITTATPPDMRGEHAPGCLDLAMETQLVRIEPDKVVLKEGKGDTEKEIPNEAVFSMIGREAPLNFFRRSGIRITGERTLKFWLTLLAALVIAVFIYQVKKGGTWLPLYETFSKNKWFPFNLDNWWQSLGNAFQDPKNILGTMKYVVGDPGFYYSFLYCVLMVVFGIRRIKRRQTPYVKRQTVVLILLQLVPLFLLPYFLLPWLGFNGVFDEGLLKTIADALFPEVSYGSGREYWRTFGLILAWPLFFWNVFTDQPHTVWLILSFVQTFVLIPFIVMRWGKGAYCGWICSCGGLAETLGDTHRHKMPHGPLWNRLNMIGQVFLGFALFLLLFRICGWIWEDSVFGKLFKLGFYGSSGGKALPWSYVWFVDLLWAGIIGFGLYFHFSGRMWCRFACPLAALMHIYARFGKFRIFSEKSKCISCNVCTSVCHQGIDVMNFANKGVPMEDPQCVRCSACVQQCPTGVLSFGRLGKQDQRILDKLPASPVQMREKSSKS